MPLLQMPNELLLQVMKDLWDSQDVKALQAAACTCKVLREISEVYLYSTAKFIHGSILNTFLDAGTRVAKRRSYLRSLKLLYSAMGRHDPSDILHYSLDLDLTSFPNLESLALECFVRYHGTTIEDLCGSFNDQYMRAFTQASLLSESLETPRPFQKLRSLTLIWISSETKTWDIEPTSPVFLLPQLQSLEISYVDIS
ncbi:uncharacterized protein F4812DRAFT_464330 [Daldinia caldariorum]|uniref:uncharacterized protein n=1 Tax=Daldinia caldariorum TaxID=326644 RepID=UPI002007F39B|nr:uncharacterized protein F4812DRAFT_464330 [Daldinia caldariorum]KAI1472163.1 hypothetical protein F4812DRAFT_464330 [Daldinia caldariorum]